MMLWRNGRRFREVFPRGRCMSVVDHHQGVPVNTCSPKKSLL